MCLDFADFDIFDLKYFADFDIFDLKYFADFDKMINFAALKH